MTESNSHQHADADVRSLYGVYIALIVLLVLTVGASFVHLPGPMNIVVTMTIAVIKATMVVLIFMHVAHSGKLVWVYAVAAFVWLRILVVLTFGDYATRLTLTRVSQFPQDAPFAHTVTQRRAPQPRG